MPTYTYKCKKCEHETDVFHSMTETPKVKCEACGSTRMSKQLGIGAGIIFKGSGFYATDYNKSAKETSEKPKSETTTSEKSETKSESKTESKSTDKSASAKSD